MHLYLEPGQSVDARKVSDRMRRMFNKYKTADVKIVLNELVGQNVISQQENSFYPNSDFFDFTPEKQDPAAPQISKP